MNPLDAFSFGKIIKTFIPGLIVTGVPLLLVEGGHFCLLKPEDVTVLDGTPLWSFFLQNSLILGKIADGGLFVAFLGALLIPLALTLGFFLNTLHWYYFHDRCVSRVVSSMETPFRKAYERLEGIARQSYCRTFVLQETSDDAIPKVHIEASLLPRVDLQKFNYIRESYFSWYEFDMNSLYALVLSTLTHAVFFVYLAVRWSTMEGLVVAVGIPAVWAGGTSLMLYRVAMKNLRLYRERSLWFFVSSVCGEEPSF